MALLVKPMMMEIYSDSAFVKPACIAHQLKPKTLKAEH
jgi:hypothetical protein